MDEKKVAPPQAPACSRTLTKLDWDAWFALAGIDSYPAEAPLRDGSGRAVIWPTHVIRIFDDEKSRVDIACIYASDENIKTICEQLNRLAKEDELYRVGTLINIGAHNMWVLLLLESGKVSLYDAKNYLRMEPCDLEFRSLVIASANPAKDQVGHGLEFLYGRVKSAVWMLGNISEETFLRALKSFFCAWQLDDRHTDELIMLCENMDGNNDSINVYVQNIDKKSTNVEGRIGFTLIDAEMLNRKLEKDALDHFECETPEEPNAPTYSRTIANGPKLNMFIQGIMAVRLNTPQAWAAARYEIEQFIK